MVIRILAVPDSLDLFEFDEVFHAVLGWDNIGFLFRVHGQEFNSFRRATRSRTLREFQLRPTETFRYTCGAIDLWEWEVRLLDEDPGSVGDDVVKIFKCVEGSRSSMMDVEDEHNHMRAAFGLRYRFGQPGTPAAE